MKKNGVRNHNNVILSLSLSLSLSFSLQPDGVPKLSQAKTGIKSETDQEVEPNKAANKVYRKISEEDLNLEPLCDEVIGNCYFCMTG
jgi:hypothetical protein